MQQGLIRENFKKGDQVLAILGGELKAADQRIFVGIVVADPGM